MNAPHKVLIVGAGFGGLSCAQKLANDSRFEVTLIDRQNHHLFQPLLYQVATAALSAPDIARSVRAILEKASNVNVLLDQIEHIDPDKNEAKGKSKTYNYDSLVLATGVRTSFFGKEEWRDKVSGMKTLADAHHIRHRFLDALEEAEKCDDPKERQRLMTIAIVGGGPTGVELAGAFAELMNRTLHTNFKNLNPENLRVVIIEAAPRLLMPYPEDQSAYTKEQLEKEGVEVMVDTMVTDVQDKKLVLKTGKEIDAHTIIWAAGMEATRVVNFFEVPKDRAGRFETAPDLSLPGHPNVFAVGDLVALTDTKDQRVPWVAPAASQMGRHVAKVLKDDLKLKGREIQEAKYDARPKFAYWDKGMMAIIGRNRAVVKAGAMKLHGFIAWAAWLFIHILFLVGFQNKISVLVSWAAAYLGNKPGARVYTNESL